MLYSCICLLATFVVFIKYKLYSCTVGEKYGRNDVLIYIFLIFLYFEESGTRNFILCLFDFEKSTFEELRKVLRKNCDISIF